MLFYLFLPLMFWVSKSVLGCVLLIASALAALFIPPWVLGAGTGPSSESWVCSPIPFYLAFAVGVVTLRASQVMGERSGFIPSAVVLAVFLIAIAFHQTISFEQNIVLYSVLTAALILGGAISPRPNVA
jgi:peptidoglycan/LPS O-acetylase OafA/YrhL